MRFFSTILAPTTVLSFIFLTMVPDIGETISSWKSYPDDHSIKAVLDKSVLVNGKTSARLNLNSGQNSERISFFQTIKGSPYLGRTIQLTAQVKTGDFKGQVALAGATYEGTPYLYIYSQPIKNPGRNHDWQVIELNFVVPPKTASLGFGLLFKGAIGTVWLADVKFGTANSCEPHCASGIKSGRLTHAEHDRLRTEQQNSLEIPQNLDFSAR